MSLGQRTGIVAMGSHAQVLASRTCHPLPTGRAWHADFFGGADMDPRAPHAMFVHQEAGVELARHFHDSDQFQIFVKGDGRLGNETLSAVSVHYARRIPSTARWWPAERSRVDRDTFKEQATVAVGECTDRKAPATRTILRSTRGRPAAASEIHLPPRAPVSGAPNMMTCFYVVLAGSLLCGEHEIERLGAVGFTGEAELRAGSAGLHAIAACFA